MEKYEEKLRTGDKIWRKKNKTQGFKVELKIRDMDRGDRGDMGGGIRGNMTRTRWWWWMVVGWSPSD